MRIQQIDPRDQTSEVDAPSYRVYFWERTAYPNSWISDEWELSETDLPDVLSWIEANANGRSASVWVVVRDGSTTQLIRLVGTDPTAAADSRPSWATMMPAQ